MKNVINVTTREQENSTDQEIFNSLNKSLGFVPNLHAATVGFPFLVQFKSRIFSYHNQSYWA